MKRAAVLGPVLVAVTLLILFSVKSGARVTLSQTSEGVTAHTVIYVVRQYSNGSLKSERIVSRSVNEHGEWYEENLFPTKGKGVAILEDGHYFVNSQTGDKVRFKSATPPRNCAGWADKVRPQAKAVIEVAGLTAFVVGGEEAKDLGLSYERAYARETGCTPLTLRIKSNDGSEITAEALQVIFPVNSTFGKEMPVTNVIREE